MRRLILDDPNLSGTYELDLAGDVDAKEAAVKLAARAYSTDPWAGTPPDGGWPTEQLREWAFMWTSIRDEHGQVSSVVAEHELEAARDAARGLDEAANPHVDIEEV